MRTTGLLRCGFWILGFVLVATSATGQQDVIRLTTKEVVLDLIIRDHKGHPVDDLRPEEVRVFEDGVPQKVNAFHLVGGQEQMAAEASAAKAETTRTDLPHALNSMREMNFVSIVFAPMAGANLDFARQAVLQFFKGGALPNTVVTIFRLDSRLRLIQPYTADLAKLERATEASTSVQPGVATSFAAAAMSTQNATTAANAAVTASTRGSGNPTTSQPSLAVNDPTFLRYGGTLDATVSAGVATQAETELENRLRFVDNYVTGMTLEDGLSELIRSQARLQGRKIVLYLSDGLVLPANRQDVFQRLISDANRSGVTFYTVDTRGLTVTSPEAPSIAALNRTSTESAQTNALQNGNLTGSAAFDAGSSNEDLQLTVVSNTQLALQELATRTGGFATANTNEIAKPMRRVMEDIRTHYELAYTPASDVYDGHFRKITVKVDRAKVNVQTRSGYYALPDLNGEPIQQYEMTALNAINTRPLPTTFPFKSDLLEFRPSNGAVQCQIALEVPIASLSFQQDVKTGNSRMHASLFAIVQDGRGQVVDKLSRELFREVKSSEIAKIKDEKIEYAEPVQLAPGHYTVSAVVMDQNLNRTAVQRRSIYVASAASGHLALSSVEIVKRVDPLAGPRDPQDPFQMEQQRVTPTLAENVTSGKPVPLYFVVYPSSDSANLEPKLTIELSRDGKVMTRSAVELPKPDPNGSIPMVAQLSLTPGSYTLQLTAQQGTQTAQTMRSLTVE